MANQNRSLLIKMEILVTVLLKDVPNVPAFHKNLLGRNLINRGGVLGKRLQVDLAISKLRSTL
jgi:hypothetical protein